MVMVAPQALRVNLRWLKATCHGHPGLPGRGQGCLWYLPAIPALRHAMSNIHNHYARSSRHRRTQYQENVESVPDSLGIR